MLRITLASSLLLATAAFATSPPAPIAVELGHPVTLVKGGAATHGKFIVIYSRVVNDSRCPANAQCITAGSITVRLSMGAVGGTLKDLDVTVSAGAAFVDADGYRVTVLGAEPDAVKLELSRSTKPERK